MGTDLIGINEIREMPSDEQLLFLHDAKLIHYQKVHYFEHAGFVGKFDDNPLEKSKR